MLHCAAFLLVKKMSVLLSFPPKPVLGTDSDDCMLGFLPCAGQTEFQVLGLQPGTSLTAVGTRECVGSEGEGRSIREW